MGSTHSMIALNTSSLDILQVAVFLYFCWLAHKAWRFYSNAALINHHPGRRNAFGLMTMAGRLFPKNTRGINRNTYWKWPKSRKEYEENHTAVLSDLTLFRDAISFSVSNPEAARILNWERKVWVKPVEFYRILRFFGNNVVTTEHDEWKRHRKIVTPGFNDAVFDLVWQTATEVFFLTLETEGLDSLKAGQTGEIDDIPEYMLKAALAVLSVASFGAPLRWSDVEDREALRATGHELSFVEAITGVSRHLLLSILLPKSLHSLPIKRVQTTMLANRELKSYMHNMIRERKEEIKRGQISTTRKDLFNQLIQASLHEVQTEKGFKPDQGLADDELVGNTFIFALAGHETSAHTLAFAFGYLATQPAAQAWLLEELMEVMPDGHLPTYKDFSRLPRTLAFLYETLRLHPSVVNIPKVCTEDTYLPDEPESWFSGEGSVLEKTGERRQVFVPKGSYCSIDVAALHRHPVHWPNPLEFRPERFLADYNHDAFVPFSTGPRGCVGRKFAEVTDVALIALFVRHFEVKPAASSSFANETVERIAEKLLNAKNFLTLAPVINFGLDFKKREGEGVMRPTFEHY